MKSGKIFFVIEYLVLFTFVQSSKDIVQNRFDRIIGGYRPKNHDLAKFIVSLRYGSDRGVFGSNHLCGGCIISYRVILTAAHCLQNRTMSKILVVAGNPDRLTHTDSERIYTVRKMSLHPTFNTTLRMGDIGLLHLDQKIDENNVSIARIPLANELVMPGIECITFGWGNIIYFGPQSDELVYLNMTLLPNSDCEEYINLAPGVICAGDPFPLPKSAGMGDSGGPLICNGTLVGITSFIIPIRTFYSSVWYYKYWIVQNDTISMREQSKFLHFLFILLLMKPKI